MSSQQNVTDESIFHRVQELEFLVDLSHHLTASLDVEDVLQRIADGVVEILQAFGCAIYLLEDDGQTLTPMAVIDSEYYDEIMATPLHVDDSFTGQAIKARRGLVFNEMFEGDGGTQIPNTPELEDEAVLAVPLVAEGQVFGGMAISKVGDTFSDHDRWLAEAFARYASIALKNAQNHQSLQLSEDRFRTVSELTSDYSFEYQVNADFSLENKWVTGAIEKITGFSAAEVAERGGWASLIHPDDRIIPTRQFKKLLQNQTGVVEYRIAAKSGQIRWVRDYARPVWSDEEGRVVRIFGAVQDITAQKEAEIALTESESRFRTLFNDIPVACWTFDREGRVLEWNKTAERIYGWPAEEAVGKTMFELMVRPKNVARTWQGINAVFRGETVLNVEYEDNSADGRRVVLLANEYPLKNSAGEVVAGICAEIDITARKDAEAAREQALRQYQSLVENAPYAIANIASNGKILYVNPAFTRIFGYTLADIPDTETWFNTVYPDPEYREKVRATWQGVWQYFEEESGGQPSIDTFEVTAKDGRTVITRFHRVFLGDGTILSTMDDVTARVKAERALKESEARLQQAQKMESIGTLAGGVAHDFNNLLTAINGQAELGLMKLPQDHPVRKNLTGVLAAGERAAKLTGQLLAFSRRQMYQPQAVDINQCIHDLQDMLRRLIREDITIETTLSPNLPPVKADPHQLEQILINLMVNARDAVYAHPNQSHRKTITIDTRRITVDAAVAALNPDLAPGPYVSFSISDTGVGMDESLRKKIFEPFFTTKPKGQGTGLGLAMVYGIVKQNDGYITVYSEPGVGTTVKVFWPLAEEENPAQTAADTTEEQILTGTETILLVEDDPQVRVVVAEALQSLGYTLMVAENGARALQILAESRNRAIDILVTDVVMPEIDGPHLAELLRKKQPGMPVLFISGYTDNLLGNRGSLMQNVHFLQKPFSAVAFARAIRDALDRTAGHK